MDSREEIARDVIRFISSASISTVVSNMIWATTPRYARFHVKLFVRIGELIATSLIGDLAADHIIAKFQENFGLFKEPEKKEKE